MIRMYELINIIIQMNVIVQELFKVENFIRIKDMDNMNNIRGLKIFFWVYWLMDCLLQGFKCK